MDRIWSYYEDAARSAGRNPDTGKPYGYSLEFFFCNARPQDQNELVRSFLGDDSVCLRETRPPSDEEIRRYTSQVKPLYDGQVEAISKALSYPISLVQGPPGTGKTEMILGLISVILHHCPGATIAVVSTNNEAIYNIVQKIDKDKDTDPVLGEISEKFAVLGRKSNILDWRKTCVDRGEDVSAINGETAKIDGSYLRRYPVFSSTVHSLRKIFTTGGDFEGQFDYVIADECSQMSIMLGIVAMSCAKNLVLIGDNEQLPPVISQTVKSVSPRHPDLPDRWKEAEGKSILSLCEEIFPGAPRSFLNCHYRCHPSIIDFCDQYIYQNRLNVRTSDDGQFRMRAVWYAGDYCEKVSGPNGDEADVPVRRRIYNRRQIEIFLREELPRLMERLKDPDFSAAVISPFRYEIEQLGERLRETMADPDISEYLEEDDIPHLTIHRAQGKGYDVVYLLTVEDYYTKDPWSQRRRLINVAVSRAKQEFCIIVSSQWLPEALQKRLTGYVLPNGEESEPDGEGMYCRKLLRYIADRCPEPQGEFGFHHSGITSVFDLVPRFRQDIPAAGKTSDRFLSAPARCVETALLERFGDRYTILRELPLRDIEQTEDVPCDDEELLRYRQNSRMDFAVCEGNRIRLLIEVDGAFHRDAISHCNECDRAKDMWIRQLLQAEDMFMRLPTDGSTENEIEIIEAALAGGSGPMLTISDETADRTRITAQAQDTVELLLGQLEYRVDEHLAALRDFFSRADLSTEQKISEVKMDFTHAETMSYDIGVRNSFYLCRYAVAYAFEYAMLYDLALRLRLESDNTAFGVFSFGAGSLLDAWSLAYAKARLTAENPACDGIRLYYKGIDEQDWDTYFVNPTRIYSGEEYTPHPADQSEDEQIDGLFKKVWFYNWGIDRFLREDILGRQKKNFYYNTLVFPKIINELEDEDVARMVEALEQVNFPHDEYYLLVSHSASQREKSAEILQRMIRAINPDDVFEICCSYEEMLSPDSRRAFERAWLGEDRLVSLAGEVALPLRCYGFSSAVQERTDGSRDLSAYIDSHNRDFTYDAPREYLRTLGLETRLRAEQVRRVSQIVFDIVRLKRRED